LFFIKKAKSKKQDLTSGAFAPLFLISQIFHISSEILKEEEETNMNSVISSGG